MSSFAPSLALSSFFSKEKETSFLLSGNGKAGGGDGGNNNGRLCWRRRRCSFSLFVSSYFLFISSGQILLILDIFLLPLLILQPNHASWLSDVEAEVKRWAVAEEDGLLTLVVKVGLLSLPRGRLCQ